MQKRRVVRNKTVFAPFWIVISCILIVLMIGAGVVGVFSGSSWDGKRRYTIVLQEYQSESAATTARLAVFSIEPGEKRAIYMPIPSDALLDVPYGYKTYPASSVYRLGMLDGARGGGPLLKKSIESTFGLAVDAYFVSSVKIAQSISTQREMENMKKQYFSLTALPRIINDFVKNTIRTDTNISASTGMQIWQSVQSLRNDQIMFFDPENAAIYEKSTLADATVISALNRDMFDAVTSDYFQDRSIRREQASVEVVNATDIDRLATEYGRIFGRLGANVKQVTTAQEKKDAGCIVQSDQERIDSSVFIEYLRDVYKCTTENRMTPGGQSDILVILGKGFVQ